MLKKYFSLKANTSWYKFSLRHDYFSLLVNLFEFSILLFEVFFDDSKLLIMPYFRANKVSVSLNTLLKLWYTWKQEKINPQKWNINRVQIASSLKPRFTIFYCIYWLMLTSSTLQLVRFWIFIKRRRHYLC